MVHATGRARVTCYELARQGHLSMPNHIRIVIGGVDTHGRTHHAAVLDTQGRLLSDREFPADRGGYQQLLSWLGRHGHLGVVGVEAPAATAPAWLATWVISR